MIWSTPTLAINGFGPFRWINFHMSFFFILLSKTCFFLRRIWISIAATWSWTIVLKRKNRIQFTSPSTRNHKLLVSYYNFIDFFFFFSFFISLAPIYSIRDNKKIRSQQCHLYICNNWWWWMFLFFPGSFSFDFEDL